MIEKSGLLILVNFINLVNLGLQYLSCCWFAPMILLHLLVSGTHLQVQSHTALVQAVSCISISHFPMPQQVSVSLCIVEEMMTHRNPHGKKTSQSWSAQALQGGAVQVGRHAKGTGGCDAPSTPLAKSMA